LRQQGLQTCSADAIARELWQSENILEEIGWVLGVEPPVTRAEVRQKITSSREARKSLNHLLHPLIWTRIVDERADAVEIPLLFESCLQRQFSQVWVVTCGPEAQFERLSERLDPEQARNILATQVPTRAKLPFADEVIRTNLPMDRVQEQIIEALHRAKILKVI
jgi:dephospho-CoA kinase